MLNVHRVDRASVSQELSVLELLRRLGIRPSTSQGLKLVKQQALRVNEAKVDLARLELRHYPPLAETVWVIRAGKKEYHAVLLD